MSLNAHFNKDIIYAVRKSKPIEICGLTLYPITMYHYDEYIVCKDALAILQASLPAKYLGMDFLSALFALALDEPHRSEEDETPNEQKAAFQKVLSLLFLALGYDEVKLETIAKDIVYKRIDNNLSIDHIVVHQNGKDVDLTPDVFSQQLRPLIAYQNAIELPDEATNPDLIRESKKYQKNDETSKLKPDLDDLIASVAYLSHVSVAEILEWSVRDFQYRTRAIERDKRYMLCAQSEMSGLASFEKGNPAPSWYYDLDEDALGTTSLAELGKKLQGAGVGQKK